MALDKSTNWELRTTGNDNNGGGFVFGATGTDFSQQDAAQYTFADLASTNGNAASPQVTSASHNFVAADVGNILQITGAGVNFLVGFYQIVSAAANAATLDRACGSAAACSGGTYAVGGGLLTIQKAFNACQVGASTNIPGMIIWMKKGTYALTTPVTTAGFVNSQVVALIGYDTTHGDNTGTKPLITTSTNATDLIRVTFGGGKTVDGYYLFDNINFSNTAATPAIGVVSFGDNSPLQFRRCKFTGFTNGFLAENSGSHAVTDGLSVIQCEFANCTGAGIKAQLFSSGISTGNGVALIIGSYVHNCNTGGTDLGGVAITGSNDPGSCLFIMDSIFDSNTGHGVGTGAAPIHTVKVWSSNFTNNTNGGLNVNNIELPPTEVYNCIFWGNTGVGLAIAGASAPSMVLGFNNAFGNNGGGNITGVSYSNIVQLGQITLTSNPFISATNFALNSVAGGGLALQRLGWPNTFGS